MIFRDSLTRDASAPQHLPKQEKECIEMDPELYKLKKECNAFRHELIAEYHQLTKARKADKMLRRRSITRKARIASKLK
jgi:hypothetical protein